ncbi:MAG: enamine deaminase RidA (YjgF/YER057c/UK114 family) [Phycisphaerales bacterium]|jgi:enamine deaminase RidA (YjgF/YER057c/UK114 family)
MADQDTATVRLQELGIELPEPTTPVAAYVPVAQTGSLCFVSGQIPIVEGALVAKGSVPSEVSEERAAECARICAINALAALQGHLGSLERIKRVVRVGVFVASDAGFGGQPKVANGASELLQEVFGEAGRHARAAVGCSALPLNVPVEVELIVEVE